MAPEQACGDVDGLDERCDVFGLGAVLCEVLTAAPPYQGKEVGELLRNAARADLADAFERLNVCAADADLVRLARACLSADPADRPRDAGAVAAAITAYLAGVQDRLRKAELERAAAQARAEAAQAKIRAERRARRMTGGAGGDAVAGRDRSRRGRPMVSARPRCSRGERCARGRGTRPEGSRHGARRDGGAGRRHNVRQAGGGVAR